MHKDAKCCLLFGISTYCTSTCQFQLENLHKVLGRNLGQKSPISDFSSQREKKKILGNKLLPISCIKLDSSSLMEEGQINF